MFDYNIALYEKNNDGVWGWQSLADWARPFTDGERLDETLDGGSINVSCTTRSKAIKPFTRVRIIIKENSAANPNTYTEIGRIYRLVASTKRTRRTFAGTTLYDWTINTIELTKLLERRLISTMTTTKYIEKNFNSEIKASPTTSWEYYTAEGLYRTGSEENSIPSRIPADNDIMPNAAVEIDNSNVPQYKLYYPTGTIIDSNVNYITIYDNDGNRNYVWNVAPSVVVKHNGVAVANNKIVEVGEHTIEIHCEAYGIPPYDPHAQQTFINVTIVWTVYAYSNLMAEGKTIKSVCQRLLSSGVCRRKGVETQEFALDPTFANEYKDELAPEFSFTNCTLFEALLQVGKRIHAIPRLIHRSNTDDTHYYVTFDKLGGDELAPTMPSFIYTEKTIDVNDWCGKVDSPSQNMCNTEDVTGGAISELGGSYITVRTEDSQVEISDQNDVLIRTSKPIQQIVKLECGFISNYDSGNTVVGDITPYVYEGAEYKALSSYWGDRFPYSKGWAIYYNQGDDKIQGLKFQLTKSNSISTKWTSLYSIVNIINSVTDAGLNNLNTASGEWLRKLNFRVTYVPIAESRVTARKPCLVEGGDGNNELVYNQGANVAETSYYGEAMRGAIARLGQDVETRTYDFFTLGQNIDNLPKCGQILDGKYIATIDTEYDISKIRLTLTLTHYNMLSQFVGLDSNYRLYDISEKQSVERNVNYNELVVVGDAPNVDMGGYMMNKNVRDMIASSVSGIADSVHKIQVAKLTPYNENSYKITDRAVILPVVAFPFGTSICLNVSYLDNYGAGYQSSNAYEGETNKAAQRLVPYTDAYGEIKYLQVSFKHSTGWTQTSASDFADDTPAMLYPQLTTPDNDTGDVRTSTAYINLEKDSREQINFTYQCHFVSTRNSIIIGSGLSKYNPFVKAQEAVSTKVLWLKHSISILNRYIELGDGTVSNSTGVTPISANEVTFSAGTCPIDGCKAYAVCKQVTINGNTAYELLFGENFDDGLANGATPPTLTFAGALEQACLSDYPNCLKFVPNGAMKWQQVDDSLTIDIEPIGTFDQDILVGSQYTLYSKTYETTPGHYATADFVKVGSYYIKESDLVTAYNL